MKIARTYDDNGQSRFTDIDIPLDLLEPVIGVSDVRASTPLAVEHCRFFSFPRCVTAQHVAPRRQLIVVLSGEVEVETGDGDKRRFHPGDIILADDTTGSGHITRCLTEVIGLFVPIASIFPE